MARGKIKVGGKRGRPKTKTDEGAFHLKEEFTIEACRVLDFGYKTGKDKGASRLVLQGSMTAKMAGMLSVWTLLYNGNDQPRDGYTKIDLAVGKIKTVRIKTSSAFKGEVALDIQPKYLTGFQVSHSQNGIQVKFKAVCDAQCSAVAAFTETIEQGLFHLVIIPLQQGLFDKAATVPTGPVAPISEPGPVVQ